MKENCVRDSDAFTINNALHANYRSFMESLGREPLSKDVFCKKLVSRGFTKDQRRINGPTTRGFVGLRLKTGEEVS